MSDKLSIKLIQSGSLSVSDGSIGTGSTHIAPKNVEIYQGPDDRDVTIICNDMMLQPDFVSKIKGLKIAWLIEPVEFNCQYNYIESMKNYFDYILTHDYRFIDNKKVLFCPLVGHWIKDKNIYPKNKMLSIIASGKNQLEGHHIRHHVIRTPEFSKYIDGVFGNAYNYIEDKLIGLRDFRFHLVIENIRRDCWFTEKLIDAFVTGCLPIYWGCPSIDKYFDERGMIEIDGAISLKTALEQYLTPSYYESCLPYIKENFKIATNDYLTPEDYIYKHILEIKK